MIHSAATQFSAAPGDMTWVATVFVFLSVAASIAGICFRVMYANQRRGIPSVPVAPPTVPAITPDFQPQDYKATPATPPPPVYQVPPPSAASPRSSYGWNGWAIYDEQSARVAARQGMWAAFLIAAATGAVAYLAGNGLPLVPGITSAAWVDAAIFAALGVGLMRMSRAAAVGALVLYIVERIWAMEHTAGGFNPVVLPMIACFIQSVRATFAYHNYRRQSPYASYGSSLPTS